MEQIYLKKLEIALTGEIPTMSNVVSSNDAVMMFSDFIFFLICGYSFGEMVRSVGLCNIDCFRPTATHA